jgi:stage V sporulation protein D (sporulation-specific penicillin-binding protein)
LGAILFLIGKIVFLGYKDGERYKKKVLEQQAYISQEVQYKRGSIFDRNGNALAISDRLYDVILDPLVINTNSKAFLNPTLNALKEVFGFDPEEIKKIVEEKSGSQYQVLERLVPLEKVIAFEELQKENRNVRGVWFEDRFVRRYPFGNLASHVVGFLRSDNAGLTGVENYYDKTLTGTNGRSYGYFDSELNLQRTVHNAVDGNDVYLTIDLNIQRILQQEIDKFTKEVGCENIGIVVMNPNNGEILAMASDDEYDLNDPRNLKAFFTDEEIAEMTPEKQTDVLNRIWNNYCVTSTYEPGSVFKPFTVSASLDEGVFEPLQKFNCTGYKEIGGWKIYCNNKWGHGPITAQQAIQASCNVALMEMAQLLGKEAFYHYQKRFGFGEKTGVDLPGEAKGILIDVKKLNPTELATSSFGQSFNVTMIQMISGFCSIVNGGTYYKPHVLKKTADATGSVVEEIKPVIVQQTISEDTSRYLRDALLLTVQSGTGTKAAVKGYMVGGKTGTAQKLPRADHKYVVSFMSVVPIDNPQVVMYLVIDDPKDPEYSASSHYATTMSSRILENILPFLGVFPNGEIDYHIDDHDDETNSGEAIPE